jgi:hypothetical protein
MDTIRDQKFAPSTPAASIGADRRKGQSTYWSVEGTVTGRGTDSANYDGDRQAQLVLRFEFRTAVKVRLSQKSRGDSWLTKKLRREQASENHRVSNAAIIRASIIASANARRSPVPVRNIGPHAEISASQLHRWQF